MVVEHSDIGAGEVHIVYNWTYADAAARTGAAGLLAGDVGKIARQLDDNSLWMLIDESPVTWKDLGTSSSSRASNPMTTAGDIITGGAGGVEQRLPVGDEGEFLQVVSGEPAWASAALSLSNDSVTNALLANMNQATIKGRAVGAGTGDPTDLTGAQATAILDAMVGDSGSGGAKGLVPAPATGDASKYLKGDGTWDTPGGGGGGLSGSGVENYVLLPNQAGTTSTIASTANEVKAWRFVLPFGLTVASIHFNVGTTSAGGLCSVAVYDEAGTTKLIDSGAVSTTTGGAKSVTLGSPVVLAPGWYWLAWTVDNNTARLNGPNNDVNLLALLNAGTQQWGAATNSSAAGVMPSSLGGVSTTSSTTPTPWVKLQG